MWAGRMGRKSAEVVRALWEPDSGRNWAGAGGADRRERGLRLASQPGADGRPGNYVAVNREYQEGWAIRVLRVVAKTTRRPPRSRCRTTDLGVFRAAAFWTVRDGQITHGTEYWTDRRRRGASCAGPISPAMPTLLIPGPAAGQTPRPRPMISFMISVVPPKMVCTRPSANARATAYSRM